MYTEFISVKLEGRDHFGRLGCGLDSAGSEYVALMGCWEYSNESSVSIEGGEFHDY
jgi:hypothetical protein